MTSLPGVGGGHTADSDKVRKQLPPREGMWATGSPATEEAHAALARLEAAANRTALYEQDELGLLRGELEAAEAERDAAHAALREIADFGVSAVSGEKAVLIARAVL